MKTKFATQENKPSQGAKLTVQFHHRTVIEAAAQAIWVQTRHASEPHRHISVWNQFTTQTSPSGINGTDKEFEAKGNIPHKFADLKPATGGVIDCRLCLRVFPCCFSFYDCFSVRDLLDVSHRACRSSRLRVDWCGEHPCKLFQAVICIIPSVLIRPGPVWKRVKLPLWILWFPMQTEFAQLYFQETALKPICDMVESVTRQ